MGKLRFLFIFSALATLLSAFPAEAQLRVKQRYMGIFEGMDFVESKGKDINGNPTRPYRRRTVDLKELEAEIEVQINPESRFEFSVDFEHGGTGSAAEYDQDEEFGEFESETEKGGAVEIEEAFYQRKLTSSTDLRVGKAPLYMSLSAIMDEYPLLYASGQTSYLEARMIPYKWRETGVQLHQRVNDFTVRLAYVSGLNSELFRSDTWIGGGNQKKFEKVNADNLAFVANLEWGDVAQGRGFGLSYYNSETTDNRYKKDRYTDKGAVELWTAMGQWSFGPVTFLGESIRGHLQNSDLITDANANMPNVDPMKNNAPELGAKAFLDMLQVRVDLSESWALFGQYEHVNTFQEVTGSVFANPRFDVWHQGAGFFHRWDDICFLKFHYYTEKTSLTSVAAKNTYLLQVGFDTGEF